MESRPHAENPSFDGGIIEAGNHVVWQVSSGNYGAVLINDWVVVQLGVAPLCGKQERFLAEFTLSLGEGLEMTSRVSCHPERREGSCPN